jgi:glucose-6-phosphate isomerase
MAIEFDPTNLFDSMAGSTHGIGSAEPARHAGKALESLRAFRDSVEWGKYGFPNLPADTRSHKAYLEFAGSLKGSYDTVCVVGIGGSALGAWALDCGVRGPHPVQPAFTASNPRLVILDNVDPKFVTEAMASMNPKKTLVVVIAKSGATAETVATFLLIREWLYAALGKKAAPRIVVVTSEGKGDLKALAVNEGYRTFHLPGNVGGRFSVLSAAGLVPAALCGFDIRRICKGAAAMTGLCWQEDLDVNIALNAALHHWLICTQQGKSIHVAFPYANRLWGTAFWFRQLWAESLGKKFDRQGNVVHAGQTPIAALGTTDQHSQVQLYMEGPNDKTFTFWTVKKPADPGRIPRAKTGLEAMDYLAGQTLARLMDAEQRATAAALTESNRPNSAFSLDRMDAEHLGAFLQLLEFETAFTGELMGIDAFDQPGVELGKQFTFALMGRKGFGEFGDRFQAYEAKRAGK